jgi:penicillin amidase
MKLGTETTTLPAKEGVLKIRRLQGGFPRVEVDTTTDLFFGLGYVHGHDRQMHMWLLKVLLHGRASETFTADPQLIELDEYLRWVDLPRDSESELQKLAPAELGLLQAYCDGVNRAVSDAGRPFEFRLFGYRPDPWTPADCLTMVKAAGFVGLAQSQADMEKFILQMIQNGVDPLRLKELFPNIEDDIDPSLIETIKKVKLVRPPVSGNLAWLSRLSGFKASNNWALGPAKTASGKPMLCGDPHLRLQLPSVWYNVTLVRGDYFLMGGSMPGIPAVAVGRTPHLAWAVTYSPADVSDNFIEEVRDGRYRHGEQWREFEVREEVLRPKKKPARTLRFYENERGLLEGAPTEDGYYLTFAWTALNGATARTLQSFLKLFDAQRVEEALDCFADSPFAPFNWIAADTEGNIGYQMSGLIARKPAGASGLLPLLGWDPGQNWRGTVDPARYPRVLNPEEGFVVTANQDLNRFGDIDPINLPMSSYRADRITERLAAGSDFTVADMQALHYDTFSKQAEVFMRIVRPLLPDTADGRLLAEWDLRYDADSRGAELFERVYLELLKIVFGEKGLGLEVMLDVIFEGPMLAMLHGNFDRVLLSEQSAWFDDSSREEIYARAIERALQRPAKGYGRTRPVVIKNLLFDGKLPRFLGFDYGPFPASGCRATIPQLQFFKAMGQEGTFSPTLRMITDLATREMHTNLAGGASDRRFSKYYTLGLKDWREGRYERYKP